MKRFLLIAAIILISLVLIDALVLKDKGLIEKAGQPELEELDPESLPIGLGIDEVAPSFTLTDLDGKEVSLEDFRGKKVLLNFWASWCPPCRAEMPDMEKFYQNNKDNDIVVLAVNMATTESHPEDAPVYIEVNEFTFPVPVDYDGKVKALYNVISLPTSYFIDSSGVIREKVIGPMSAERMEKEISKLP